MAETTDSLTQIASEVSACEKCKLHAARKRAVPGEGPATATLPPSGMQQTSTGMCDGNGEAWYSRTRTH